MSLKVQILKAQKILVGSVGVATLSFLAGCRSAVSNLMAAPSCDVAPNAPYCIGPRPDAKPDTRVDAAVDVGADGHDTRDDTASDAMDTADDATDAADGATDAADGAAPDAQDSGSDKLADATDGTG
jgi:hypothetical protein